MLACEQLVLKDYLDRFYGPAVIQLCWLGPVKDKRNKKNK